MVNLSPENLDILPKDDAELAAHLLDKLIGTRGVREPVKGMLERAYVALSRQNDVWTRRRVRTIFHKESSNIKNREIEELKAAINERDRLAVMRTMHAEIIKTATRVRELAE